MKNTIFNFLQFANPVYSEFCIHKYDIKINENHYLFISSDKNEQNFENVNFVIDSDAKHFNINISNNDYEDKSISIFITVKVRFKNKSFVSFEQKTSIFKIIYDEINFSVDLSSFPFISVTHLINKDYVISIDIPPHSISSHSNHILNPFHTNTNSLIELENEHENKRKILEEEILTFEGFHRDILIYVDKSIHYMIKTKETRLKAKYSLDDHTKEETIYIIDASKLQSITLDWLEPSHYNGLGHNFTLKLSTESGRASIEASMILYLIQEVEFNDISLIKTQFTHKVDKYLKVKINYRQYDQFERNFTVNLVEMGGAGKYLIKSPNITLSTSDPNVIDLPFPVDVPLPEGIKNYAILIEGQSVQEDIGSESCTFNYIYSTPDLRVNTPKREYYRGADPFFLIEGSVEDQSSDTNVITIAFNNALQDTVQIEMADGNGQINRQVRFADDFPSGSFEAQIQARSNLNKESDYITLPFTYLDITLDFIISEFTHQSHNTFNFKGSIIYNHPGDNVVITARVESNSEEVEIFNNAYYDELNIDETIDIRIPPGNQNVIFRAYSNYISKTESKNVYVPPEFEITKAPKEEYTRGVDMSISLSGKVTYSPGSNVDIKYYLNIDPEHAFLLQSLSFESSVEVFNKELLFSEIGINDIGNYTINIFIPYSTETVTGMLIYSFPFQYLPFTPILTVNSLIAINQSLIEIDGVINYVNIDDPITLSIILNSKEIVIKEFHGANNPKHFNEQFNLQNNLSPGRYSAVIKAATQYEYSTKTKEFTVKKARTLELNPYEKLLENIISGNFLLSTFMKLICMHDI